MAIEEVFGGKQEHMVSLADFTRSLFVQDKETREMRIPELSTELSDLAIDFTARRKEEGALRNSILGREIRRFYMVRQKDTQDMWTSKYIETEADFLRFLVTDLLQSGTNLLDPDALIYSRGVPYSAGYVLTRFAAKLNQAKDPYLKACSDIPYHMLAHLRGNAKKSPDKESQDMVIAIIERTKHSQSENKKQAIRWANDNYFLLKLNPYFTYLQLLESAIASDLPQPEFPSRLRDIAKIADELRREEPNEGRRFENRLDELRSRWYYGVGDSNGASIIKSRELIKNGKEYEDIEVLKDFFRSHEIFELVPGSF
ncbi:MAG: hypothetical protein HGA85_00180, partial [Nanoarchaeota archaeon]|nr:hypothetical protein [Nanoarchaeota archaeon]